MHPLTALQTLTQVGMQEKYNGSHLMNLCAKQDTWSGTQDETWRVTKSPQNHVNTEEEEFFTVS